MTNTDDQFTIPTELQGFCDIYLNNLRGRLAGLGEKGSAALNRAISYFEGNPQALVREVTVQLELRPSYFGLSGEGSVSSEVQPTSSVAEETQGEGNHIGPEEAAILKDIESRFSAQGDKDLLSEMREHGIKGTRL